MNPVNVGLVGLGTVGCGTVSVLRRNENEICRRAGRSIQVSHAAVRDPQKERSCDLSDITLTTDPFEVVDNPEIEIIVELIGGESLSLEIVLRAIRNGKHVVTANKALIAIHGNEIFSAAQEQGVTVAFEAAVGGGISIIKALREGLAGNCIEWLAGIINGTGNFILSEMRDAKRDFSDVLAEAQARGYAEADPSFDVDGIDAAHKLTILASIAFGIPLQYNQVYVEGISALEQDDVEYATELGYRIKHLGIAKRVDEGIELRVHPTLIPERRLIANVDGVMNAILVKGDAVGPTLYYGAGAGAEPTASAVVADIVDVTRTLTSDPHNRVPHLAFQPGSLGSPEILPVERSETAYYLRMNAVNRPGVLAEVTRIFGDLKISIESILQKDRGDHESVVPIIILTQHTKEFRLDQALVELEKLDNVNGKIVRIRVETLK
tara:strand:- start:8191 stop:9501 length:1311 start_codon:yes stop_codon:yes gene_type:complete